MKGIVANNHWRRANLRRGSFVPRKSLVGHTGARNNRKTVAENWQEVGWQESRYGLCGTTEDPSKSISLSVFLLARLHPSAAY